MNFNPAVCGSVLETELLSVYMTNMAVMDTGIAVLKCSFLKYNVACDKLFNSFYTDYSLPEQWS